MNNPKRRSKMAEGKVNSEAGEVETFFGGGKEKEIIPAEESLTGEEIDLSAVDNEMKKNWYKEIQGKYTKKRQEEKAELDGLREVKDKFTSLQEWPEFQTWAKMMRDKYPEEGGMPKTDLELVRRIEALEGKTGAIDTIQYEKELDKLETFVSDKGLPAVEKYYPRMQKILDEKADSANYVCSNCGAPVKGDGKSGLDAVELYMLSVFPDLLKLAPKNLPPHLETSSGCSVMGQSDYFDDILKTKRGI